MNGLEYEAVEHNPEKPSGWGQLARDGHQVAQFKDNETSKFIAVAVDEKVKECGSLGRDDLSPGQARATCAGSRNARHKMIHDDPVPQCC